MSKTAIIKLIFILLIIAPLIGLSQNKDTTKAKRMSVILMFSPDYCYRTINANQQSQWIADIRNTTEIPKFGFMAGAYLDFRLSKKFVFETGLLYSDNGYDTKYTPLIYLRQTPASPTEGKFNYTYSYLDIPMKIKYEIPMRRAAFYIDAGTSAGIFINEKVKSTSKYNDGHTTTNSSTITTGFTKINLVFTGGIGYSFYISNKLVCRIEPTYRRSITSIVDAPIKEYLYSVGIEVGVELKL